MNYKKLIFISIIIVIPIVFFAFRANKEDLQIYVSGRLRGAVYPVDITYKNFVEKKYGGIRHLSGTYLSLRESTQKKNETAIFLDIGDNLHGSSYSHFSQAEIIYKPYSIFRPDAMLLGNLELEFGQEVLSTFSQISGFPILAANLKVIRSKKVLTSCKPYSVIDRGGYRVGVIGVVPERMGTMTIPKNMIGLEVEDVLETLSENIIELKKKNCDLIVVITQENINPKRKDKLEKLLGDNDIDLVIGLNFDQPQPFSMKMNNIQCVGHFANAFGGVITKITIKPNKLKKGINQIKTDQIVVEALPENIDPRVEELITDMEIKLDPKINKTLGKVETILKASNIGESTLGNMITDAIVSQYGCDIAMINSGGIRGELSGNVTLGDLFDVLPFENRIVIVSIQGKHIQKVIEDNLRKGEVLQISKNCRYIFSEPRGELDLLEIRNQVYEPEKFYKVATNEYMYESSNKVHFMHADYVEFKGKIKEVVSFFIRKNSPLYPQKENRILIKR